MRSIAAVLLLAAFVNAQSSAFLEAAAKRAKISKEKFASKICAYPADPVARRVFWEYGSVFIADRSVIVPSSCVFVDEPAVKAFQQDLQLASVKIGSAEITLQIAAMRALLDAVQEAGEERLRITPLDGTIAGTRSYADTERLWSSRFDRALNHWERLGRIPKSEADTARASTTFAQVPIVMKWEQQKLWFSTGFNRSIFNSVAAPGTSQHLSGLAFDVVEHSDDRIRAILNKNGWYQTIRSDEPHFTYLGHDAKDLPGRGLEMIVHRGKYYWVPKIDSPSTLSELHR